MPGLVTMKPVLKPRGSCSKAMARVKEERGLGALLSQVRVSPGKRGRRPADLQALGGLTRSNLAMKLRMKLLGEGGDDEERDEDVSSEHEPSSVRLAAMVDEFLEDEINDRKRGRSRFDDAPGEESKSPLRDELAAVLHSNADSKWEKILVAEVNSVVGAVTVDSDVDGGVAYNLRSRVMRHLRRAGFDAGICKSRWDHLGGFPGGDYEYIDVVFEDSSARHERIVIDVDFKAQFEIARPTAYYDALVQSLPSIFVGRADQLLSIINVMSEAVKLSLKKRGMHLPPWRKPDYMRAKWFSSHKRTTKCDKSTEGGSDKISEASDVFLVADASVKSSELVLEPEKLQEKPAVNETIIGNRLATGEGAALVSNSIDNNDWHLPILNAKKSRGPGQAGLASLFRKPVGSAQ